MPASAVLWHNSISPIHTWCLDVQPKPRDKMNKVCCLVQQGIARCVPSCTVSTCRSPLHRIWSVIATVQKVIRFQTHTLLCNALKLNPPDDFAYIYIPSNFWKEERLTFHRNNCAWYWHTKFGHKRFSYRSISTHISSLVMNNDLDFQTVQPRSQDHHQGQANTASGCNIIQATTDLTPTTYYQDQSRWLSLGCEQATTA